MAFPLCMNSGFPIEKVEQMIVMSLDDVHSDCSCYLGEGSI